MKAHHSVLMAPRCALSTRSSIETLGSGQMERVPRSRDAMRIALRALVCMADELFSHNLDPKRTC
jgi:hypothetical protein